MTTKSVPNSDKLPPRTLNKDTPDESIPHSSIGDRRAPPVNMGTSRVAGAGLTEADLKTGRADPKGCISAPQTANRE
jgi:hypothetical protein